MYVSCFRLFFLILQVSSDKLVADKCMTCICEAATSCNQTIMCDDDEYLCGMLGISNGYWTEAGKPTTGGEPASSPTAFFNCVTNPHCAKETVQSYMDKFKKDCNGDHKIDCLDFLALHKFGVYGCENSPSGSYLSKFNDCYEKPMRVKGQINDVCLGCICEAVSGCNTTSACDNGLCGPFRISNDYWLDGDKPTLKGESSNAPQAFQSCVNDHRCAAEALENYVIKYKTDCNGDQRIDCLDYAAIHLFGPNDCKTVFPEPFSSKLYKCLESYGAI